MSENRMPMSELIELYKIGEILGAAQGDANWGFEQMAIVIEYKLYMHLDNIGINAGAVRERAKELQADGLSEREAFLRAVLEQGREAVKALSSTG